MLDFVCENEKFAEMRGTPVGIPPVFASSDRQTFSYCFRCVRPLALVCAPAPRPSARARARKGHRGARCDSVGLLPTPPAHAPRSFSCSLFGDLQLCLLCLFGTILPAEQGHFLYNERGWLHFDRLSIRCRGCERSFVPLCCVPCRAARSGTGSWRGAMLERPASAPSPLSVGCRRPRGRAWGLSER